jgi:uracil-DNA glycosylase
MGSLDDFVKRIRLEQGLDREVPGFDPKNGNESAKFLFVLEAPGAKAVNTGFISFENPDQTAANFRYQLQEAWSHAVRDCYLEHCPVVSRKLGSDKDPCRTI